MIVPTREEFFSLAAQASQNTDSVLVVPVHRVLLADQVTPVAVFARLCGEGPGFLLESVDHGGRWSRWSFVGRNAPARIVQDAGHTLIEGDLGVPADVEGGVLAVVESILDRHKLADLGPLGDGFPPLHSGLVGYLGYDVVREVENLPNEPADSAGYPDAVLSLVGDLVALDHWSQRAILIATVYVQPGCSEAELDQLYSEAVDRINAMAEDGASPIDEPMVMPPTGWDAVPAVSSSLAEGMYERAVDVAKEHIVAGDIFQVVLSQRFEFEIEADPFDVYRVLRQINPSPYMYFLREPELCLVGCSPEPMVQLLEGRVISRPIAGTRFRGTTDEHDRKLAAELLEHPKERAEHIMLVDLARNDVGRVVEFGTCQVDELMTLERFSHVMHLTSQVSGKLATGKSAIDVLRATLPAGTVSGAPKVRAMEIIDSLEPTKRGPYAGIVGYMDFAGNIDTAIAIRTMIIDNPTPEQLASAEASNSVPRRRASVQAGAGVVADSVPADEELETRNKAKALLAAVLPAERMTAERRLAAGSSRAERS